VKAFFDFIKINSLIINLIIAYFAKSNKKPRC